MRGSDNGMPELRGGQAVCTGLDTVAQLNWRNDCEDGEHNLEANGAGRAKRVTLA